MYHKVKNTMAGLMVALSMLAVSYSVGAPPRNEVASIDLSAPGFNAQIDSAEIARKRNIGMKRQMSMPFFSFAPILPKRES